MDVFEVRDRLSLNLSFASGGTVSDLAAQGLLLLARQNTRE